MSATSSRRPLRGNADCTAKNSSIICLPTPKRRGAQRDIRGFGRRPFSRDGCRHMEFDSGLLQRLKFSLSGDSGHFVIRSGNQKKLLSAEYSFGIEEEYFLADAGTLEVR